MGRSQFPNAMLVTANIFQPLIDVFEAVIKFFHGTIGVPWGMSIVLLTVCVRAVLVAPHRGSPTASNTPSKSVVLR